MRAEELTFPARVNVSVAPTRGGRVCGVHQWPDLGVHRGLIGDRQGKAVDPVAGAKLALEVGGREVLGNGGDGGDDPWVLMRASASAPLDEAPAGQEIRCGARGGPAGELRI